MTNKTKYIIGFSFNLIALVAEVLIVVAFFLLPSAIKVDVTVDHTLLFYSIVISILGSLIGVVSSLLSSKTAKPINKTLSLLRSLSVSVLLFLLVFEIVSVALNNPENIVSPLMFVLIGVVLINLVSLIGFEVSYKKNPFIGALSSIFTLVYCLSSFVFSNFLSIPWDMSCYELLGNELIYTVSTAVAFVLITAVLGVLVVLFANIGSKEHIVILETKDPEQPVYNVTNITFTASEELIEGPSDDIKKKKEIEQIEITQADEESEEAEEAEERQQAKIDGKNNFNDRPRIYHISKHKPTGRWQVKLATGKRAIKIFDTQADAIEFAKTLVISQGGSIRVHSLKGKIRKE